MLALKRPPASAPTKHEPIATSDGAIESSGAPAIAKPRNTTLPVMFAT
jgi:hypothetical protein